MSEQNKEQVTLPAESGQEKEEQKPLVVFKTAELENDFNWLKALGVKNIEGLDYMTVAKEMLNCSDTMTETEFVQNWLWQFAVGLVGKHCYFDVGGWFERTNNGKMAISIVDDHDQKNVLFIIRPFTETGLTPQELRNMRVAGMQLSRQALTPDIQLRARLFKETGKFLVDSIKSKRKELQDFVPDWFFKKHQVYPWVYQHVIYIRDVFGYQPDSKALGVIQSILTKYYLRQKVSKQEYDFIQTATGNQIELDLGYKTVESEKQNSISAELDPNEC